MSSDNDVNIIIEKQNNEITALRNENVALKESLDELQMQLNWLKKQVFGKKSEKTSSLMGDDNQLSMFSDASEESL